MKYTIVLGFRTSTTEEKVDSNYLPRYVEDERTGEIYLHIVGKECGMYYYATNVYIKCIFTEQ